MQLVWDDGFGRHREEVKFISSTPTHKTFQDADGENFTVPNERIVSIDGDISTPEKSVAHDGYQGD